MKKSTKKILMIGGGIGVVVLAHRYLAKKKAAEAAAPAATGQLGDNEEYSRYTYIRRNGEATCVDRQTNRVVASSLCEREMLQGVGGMFG